MSPPERYDCEQVFRRLDDYLDGRLTAEERVLFEQHLEHCARCAREVGFESSLLEGLRARTRDVTVPATLRHKLSALLARIDPEKPLN